MIPLQQTNAWRNTSQADTPPPEKAGAPAAEPTQEEAIQLIMRKAERFEQGLGDEEKPVNVAAIPILLQNRVPNLEGARDDTEKFKIDVAQRPDEAPMEVYDDVPIEQFGEAMLRGMGWAKGQAIGGTNKKLVVPTQIVSRPSRLGLGATLSAMMFIVGIALMRPVTLS